MVWTKELKMVMKMEYWMASMMEMNSAGLMVETRAESMGRQTAEKRAQSLARTTAAKMARLMAETRAKSLDALMAVMMGCSRGRRGLA